MKHIVFALLLTLSVLLSAHECSFAQNFPHIKTFGYDYGYPRETSQLQWLAAHHDMLIGIGDFQTQKVLESQYDTLKAVNPNVIIIPYTVIQAFTFAPMHTFFQNWASAHGVNMEEMYLHYYYDTPVKMRTNTVKTSGTGTPSDRICDASGNLLPDGQSGGYYLSLGYGGGTASSLAEARIYQKWNSGFEPRMNHLSANWQQAYKEYVVDVLSVDASEGKYCDGVYLDTYPGVVDIERYLPNMHNIIEARSAGYGSSDTAARQWYAGQMATIIGNTEAHVATVTNKSKICMITNDAEIGYMHSASWYKFAVADQMAPGKLNSAAIEYLASPSKSTFYEVRDNFKPHYEFYQNGGIGVEQADTAWYNYATNKPPIGGKQFLLGSFYLFNHPNTFFGIHYGTASNYGPKPTYDVSHWDKMLEYDIGTPVVRSGADFWGVTGTDRMYLIDYQAPGSWRSDLNRNDPRGRHTLAREYTNALVIVRFEKSDNIPPPDPMEIGTEPITFPLDGTYHRLLEDNTVGPPITEITLGLSEGAILIKADKINTIPEKPVPIFKNVNVLF